MVVTRWMQFDTTKNVFCFLKYKFHIIPIPEKMLLKHVPLLETFT